MRQYDRRHDLWSLGQATDSPAQVALANSIDLPSDLNLQSYEQNYPNKLAVKKDGTEIIRLGRSASSTPFFTLPAWIGQGPVVITVLELFGPKAGQVLFLQWNDLVNWKVVSDSDSIYKLITFPEQIISPLSEQDLLTSLEQSYTQAYNALHQAKDNQDISSAQQYVNSANSYLDAANAYLRILLSIGNYTKEEASLLLVELFNPIADLIGQAREAILHNDNNAFSIVLNVFDSVVDKVGNAFENYIWIMSAKYAKLYIVLNNYISAQNQALGSFDPELAQVSSFYKQIGNSVTGAGKQRDYIKSIFDSANIDIDKLTAGSTLEGIASIAERKVKPSNFLKIIKGIIFGRQYTAEELALQRLAKPSLVKVILRHVAHAAILGPVGWIIGSALAPFIGPLRRLSIIGRKLEEKEAQPTSEELTAQYIKSIEAQKQAQLIIAAHEGDKQALAKLMKPYYDAMATIGITAGQIGSIANEPTLKNQTDEYEKFRKAILAGGGAAEPDMTSYLATGGLIAGIGLLVWLTKRK